MEKFTFDELKLISSAFGVHFYTVVMSHIKSEKSIKGEFYRNRYVSGREDPVFENLVDKELVTKKKFHNDPYIYYHITKSGEEKYRKEISELILYVPPNERDLDYLRGRIEFYCKFYNYNFGGNNSDHVFVCYVKYYLNGERMSHTTTDCVKSFKKELNLHKEELINLFKK